MSNPIHVLLVDDDNKLTQLLKRFLQQEGLLASTVQNGRELDHFLQLQTPDVLVLDIMLPGESGLDLCRRVRVSLPQVGIVMLTGKGSELDTIIGLELGADDYMTKPCNPRELLARIHAIHRRLHNTASSKTEQPHVIQAGRCMLDTRTRELCGPGALRQRLTDCEFLLLRTLVERPNQPFSRERLLDLTRGREYMASDRSVDVHVSRLRKRIEPDCKHPRYLQTVWGVGYVYVP